MTEANFRRIFQEYKDSGLTITDYCHNMNYNRSSFYYWRKRWGEDYVRSLPAQGNQEEKLIPINILDTTTVAISKLDNPSQVSSSLSSTIEIVLPSGGEIRLSGEIDPTIFCHILNKL